MLRNLRLVGAAVVAASIGIPALHNADPDLLPGLTIEDAAAGRATLWALLISIAAGRVILVPWRLRCGRF